MKLLRQWKNAEAFVNLNRICRQKKIWNRLSAINAKIGGWKEGFDPFYGAPAILIVLADKNWANRVYDGSLVMGNMMLAAYSLNLGSIWIHRAKEEFELPEYQKLLKEIGMSDQEIKHLFLQQMKVN